MTHRTRVVALVGRQNAGKTSLLMHLSGQVQRPANFPGSSVERYEATVEVDDARLTLVDLPGISSTGAISPDEAITLNYLTGTPEAEGPDVLCVVLDASKLAIECRLLMALAKLGVPLLCALTKEDIARSEGRPVDREALGKAIGVPVFSIHGGTGEGAEALLLAIASGAAVVPPDLSSFDPTALGAEIVTLGAPRTRRTLTETLDRLLLHPVLGLPIFLGIVFLVFQLIFTGAGPFMDLIDSGKDGLIGWVDAALDEGALRSLLGSGIIEGMGAILIFLPQIILLMLCVSLLETTGYMARAVFLLDRPLRKVGLSGRSFVPMASSFACAVPGILATRSIENERDRIATVVVAPLMSCSARLPVYVLLIGAFFPPEQAGIMLFAMYMLGLFVAVAVALFLRKTALKGGQSSLLMELPVYQRPAPRVLFSRVWMATRSFLVMAGTLIFVSSVIIWFLSYYPRPAEIHERFEAQRELVKKLPLGSANERETRLDAVGHAEDQAYREQSFLADAGRAVQPIFAPAGFDWRITVGLLASFPARELIIPTLGVLYGVGETDAGAYEPDWIDQSPKKDGLRDRLRNARDAEGNPSFTPLIALAIMVFFALCSQCMATLAAIKRETHSWRWPLFTFTYMTILAWVGAVAVFQIGGAMGYH